MAKYDVEPQEGDAYTVAKGDTLGDLAKRFGTTIEELMRLNPGRIRAKDKMIKAGQQLVIKAPPPGPPPPESGGPKQGRGGAGYSLGDEAEVTPKEINPTSKWDAKASAVHKEEKWRAGKEDRKLQIPVEVLSQAEAAPQATPAPPSGPSWQEKIAQAISDSANDPFGTLANSLGTIGEKGFGMSSGDAGRMGRDVAGMGEMGLTALGMNPSMGAGRVADAVAPPAVPTPRAPFGARATQAVQQAFGSDAAAAARSPTGHLPKQLTQISKSPQRTSNSLPTKKDTAVWQDNKGKFAGRSGEHEGEVIDDMAFKENVITEPQLRNPNKMSDEPPTGSKELGDTPVSLKNPVKLDATKLNSVDDWRNALREHANNDIVLENAERWGFPGPRVVIHNGDPVGSFTPEHALDSFGTPYLSRGQFLQVLKHIGLD